MISQLALKYRLSKCRILATSSEVLSATVAKHEDSLGADGGGGEGGGEGGGGGSWSIWGGKLPLGPPVHDPAIKAN